MSITNKKREDLLSADSADQMLQNIFEACNVEPNTVPLEDLESYSNYRRDKFTIQKVAIAVIIVIFLMVPLLFVSPVLALNPVESYEHGTSYNLSVNSLIPISNITAEINGNKVPVFQTDDGCYSVEPDENGELTVRVSLMNKQYDEVTANVTNVNADYDTPEMISYEKIENKIQIELKDENSGINYDGIYAKNNAGEKKYPEIISKTKKRATIAFEYNNDSLNIFLPDNASNTLQLVLTVK